MARTVGKRTINPRQIFPTGDMRLVFLPVNQTYTFTFGREANPTTLHNEPLFFKDRSDALAAAKRRGLTVGKDGIVRTV